MRTTRQRVLDIAATDSTFEEVELRGRPAWVGKCLHCNRRLAVSVGGELLDNATVEHVIPRTHGGTNELENLGLACFRCNVEKGRRHDKRRWDDPGLQRVIAVLQERRRQRWRDAPGIEPPSWEREDDE